MGPLFVTFEGPDGAGKTSQIVQLAEHLRQQGEKVIMTREPGGTSIGDQIRDTLHDTANTEMDARAEVLLYSASRAQLVSELIEPALQEGAIVLCDRYADSTIAYQGYGRGLDLEALHDLTSFATGGLSPDLTILLDLDVETGLSRRRTHGEEMNRLDLETVAFHERVRRGYHALAAQEPERWVTVNADRPPTEIQDELRRIVADRVPLS